MHRRAAVFLHDFFQPSHIQAAAVPYLLRKPTENLVFQAQTGTGKTAAFAIDVLSRCQEGVQSPQAVVIANTRALVQQIHDEIVKMARRSKISAKLVIDDIPPSASIITVFFFS
jgi:superfamily II DNA/RNA helicase